MRKDEQNEGTTKVFKIFITSSAGNIIDLYDQSICFAGKLFFESRDQSVGIFNKWIFGSSRCWAALWNLTLSNFVRISQKNKI